VLKINVDFSTLLTGAEDARSSEMYSHFLRARLFEDDYSMSCGKCGSKGDPPDLLLEEAPGPFAERECLEQKSTGEFNRDYILRNNF
jgi:hypothetical protein